MKEHILDVGHSRIDLPRGETFEMAFYAVYKSSLVYIYVSSIAQVGDKGLGYLCFFCSMMRARPHRTAQLTCGSTHAYQGGGTALSETSTTPD